jgi:hypothetical protein
MKKNLKSKISCQTPFKYATRIRCLYFFTDDGTHVPSQLHWTRNRFASMHQCKSMHIFYSASIQCPCDNLCTFHVGLLPDFFLFLFVCVHVIIQPYVYSIVCPERIRKTRKLELTVFCLYAELWIGSKLGKYLFFIFSYCSLKCSVK